MAVSRVDSSDVIILLVVALATLAWFTRGRLWKRPQPLDLSKTNAAALVKNAGARSVVDKMRQSGKNCVVFYGSQTGTAEDYAARIAKEGHQRYGLDTMTADLEDYDYDDLDQFPEDAVAFFVVATYGEGEPTDSAVAFFDFIKGEDSTIGDRTADDGALGNLRYVTFGLGNKTYEHYNEVVKVCDRELTRWGATRIGQMGMGDDGDGSMEEDFLSWKEGMWVAVSEVMSLEEREAKYEPAFDVVESADLTTDSAEVFLGEPSKKHLSRAAKPFNANNPFLGPIATSRELFFVKGRNCLHVEFDLAGSSIKYKTGDHLAVWPTNSDNEVDRLARLLQLDAKRHTVVSLKALDATAKLPVPQPSTYDALLRYYLEINGAVSRQFLSTLAQFAPSEAVQTELSHMAQDRDYFQRKVAAPHLNLGQLMETLAAQWTVPFSVFIECFGRLQPRYYSISSSNLTSPNKVSITAVVESKTFHGHENVLNGVTTNYLLALSQSKDGVLEPHPFGITYATAGPRGKYDGHKAPVHVRPSNFKLPADAAVPIIMVGPGTGVAPFRGFVQERAHCAAELSTAATGDDNTASKVGKTLLFYGCRNRNEDYLYRDEWPSYGAQLGDAFEIDVAFSREQGEKVYVQHRLRARGAEVKQLLLEHGAYFYICGDAANMAREVNNALVELVGEAKVKELRTTGRLLEDVWS